jgi:DNA-binding NarL/FixJ family response regulator
VAAWAAVAGIEIPFQGEAPAAHAAMVGGDWGGAAEAFARLGWRHDQALMLSLLDREEAWVEALEIARGLGAAPLVTRVAERMRTAGMTVPRGRHQGTIANPAGLTPRQAEVLELLREGLTNAEIAERLYVSNRTAEHHVAAVLTKLGVSSRHDAVRRSAELGLANGRS